MEETKREKKERPGKNDRNKKSTKEEGERDNKGFTDPKASGYSESELFMKVNTKSQMIYSALQWHRISRRTTCRTYYD
jgi:hypothetical protein